MCPFPLGLHAPFGVYMYVQRYYMCLGGMHVCVCECECMGGL